VNQLQGAASHDIIFDIIGGLAMGQVLIRNLDDRIIGNLKVKAELSGKSFEQSLRDVLAAAAPLTPQERVAILRKLQLNQNDVLPDVGKAEIREGLEGDDL